MTTTSVHQPKIRNTYLSFSRGSGDSFFLSKLSIDQFHPTGFGEENVSVLVGEWYITNMFIRRGNDSRVSKGIFSRNRDGANTLNLRPTFTPVEGDRVAGDE